MAPGTLVNDLGPSSNNEHYPPGINKASEKTSKIMFTAVPYSYTRKPTYIYHQTLTSSVLDTENTGHVDGTFLKQIHASYLDKQFYLQFTIKP